MQELGRKNDQNKLRYDLISVEAMKQLARVMTFGAGKYEDHNWRNGIKWSRIIAATKRHLAEIEAGHDFDKETGLLHSAHVMANMSFLTEFYKTYPIGDDRFLLPQKNKFRYGLDIDDVLSDFVGAMQRRFPQELGGRDINYWHDTKFTQCFNEIKYDFDFWSSIPVKNDKMSFEPSCYISSRPSHLLSVTTEWLSKHNFPKAEIILTNGISKVEYLKERNIDIFVDDNYDHFLEINNAGILCYLFDMPHNSFHDVGFKRIKSLDFEND